MNIKYLKKRKCIKALDFSYNENTMYLYSLHKMVCMREVPWRKRTLLKGDASWKRMDLSTLS
jgi:hypothetical protein